MSMAHAHVGANMDGEYSDSESIRSRDLMGGCVIIPTKEVMFLVCLLVCLFVSRIMEKLRVRFS